MEGWMDDFIFSVVFKKKKNLCVRCVIIHFKSPPKPTGTIRDDTFYAKMQQVQYRPTAWQ